LRAAKDENYYGFEGPVRVSFDGIICGYALAAANVDERDVRPEMVVSLIGDKDYIRPSLKQELAQQGIDLQTSLRKNMQDLRTQPLVGPNVPQTLNRNHHRAIERTFSYRLSPGTRHLAFG